MSDNDILNLERSADAFPKPKDALLTYVEDILAEPLESVMDKLKSPPSGDRHDYMSLAIYVWPDPDKPDGMPYVHRDGEVNPEIHDYDLPRFSRMVNRAETAAIAAKLTGDVGYLQRAVDILRVWFLDEATRMNPHLEYGQGIPGDCDGRCWGIIETHNLSFVINAFRILEHLGADLDFDACRAWAAQYVNWLLTSKIGIEEGQTLNNHRVWYVVQVASLQDYCGEADAARATLQRHYADMLEVQMEADGSLPHELRRTKSQHYVIFTLLPLLQCVALGRKLGIELADVANRKGATIRTGVDFLLPYLRGEKEWTWQMLHNEVPRQAQIDLLRIAANTLGDPRYETLLRTLAGDEFDGLLLNLVLHHT